MLVAEKLVKTFPRVRALDGATLRVADGSVHALLARTAPARARWSSCSPASTSRAFSVAENIVLHHLPNRRGVVDRKRMRVEVHGRAARIRNVGEALRRYRLGYVTEDWKDEGLFLEQPVSRNVAVTVWRKLARGRHRRAHQGGVPRADRLAGGGRAGAAADLVRSAETVAPADRIAVMSDLRIVGEPVTDHDYPRMSRQIIRLIHAETHAEAS